MGSLYRPKYAPEGWKYADAKARGMLRESATWWIKAGVVTLDVGSTKNKDGRTFPMTPELRATLEAQGGRLTRSRRRSAPSSRGCSTGPRAGGP